MNTLATIIFILIGALLLIATADIIVRLKWNIRKKRVFGSSDFEIHFQEAALEEAKKQGVENIEVILYITAITIVILSAIQIFANWGLNQ